MINFKKAEKPVTTIVNKTETQAEILIYGDIGGFWEDSVSAQDVNNALKSLPKTVNQLDVRISSLGGDVFVGIAIYNRLKNFNARVKVYVDSIAASIASVIAMAGDEIVMGDGAQIMIHKPWTYTAGNSKDLMETIDRLDDVEEQLLSIYQKNTGLDRSEIKAMLAAETFLDAEQCLDMGFATGMMNEAEYSNIAASFNTERAMQWMRKSPKINNVATQKVVSEIDNILEGIK